MEKQFTIICNKHLSLFTCIQVIQSTFISGYWVKMGSIVDIVVKISALQPHTFGFNSRPCRLFEYFCATFSTEAYSAFQLPLSISLDSRHPPSPNQHPCSPSLLASSMSSLVILASSCPSLQTPMLFSKHAHHPSSTHARTISLHLSLPSEPLFPSIPTSPLGSLSSFSPSVLHHTLLSPLLSRPFSKLPFYFPSNIMSHSHITSFLEYLITFSLVQHYLIFYCL